MKKLFGVYQITNTQTGDYYIGSTASTFSKRWYQHKLQLKNNKNSPHLQRAWNKYGESAFEFSILEVVENKRDVISREQYWIDKLNPVYNICPIAGSRLGSTTSEVTRSKLRQTLKEKYKDPELRKSCGRSGASHYRFGQTVSEETRQKISATLKGRQPSNLEQLKTSNVGRSRPDISATVGDRYRGKQLSPEHRAKLSEAWKLRKQKYPDTVRFSKP